jgi:hypothetical protein
MTTYIMTIYIYIKFFCECNFRNSGACNTLLKRYFQELPKIILKPTNFLQFQWVKQKKIYNRLVTIEQAGQNNRNGKNDCNSFA